MNESVHADELSPRMVELNTLAEKDLKIPEAMLKEKSHSVPGLKMKWLRLQYEEERYLKTLKESLQTFIDGYVLNLAKQGTPNIKAQKDAKDSPEAKALAKEIREQQDVVRFIEDINVIWKGFGFDIKACIDIKKMEEAF